jgi:nucleoside-diphosphate-sugar epimerase
MKVGLIGLGHIGFPIARHLHECGHEIFSWTRVERMVSWKNSQILEELPRTNLDILFVVSGAARPNYGDHALECATTVELLSQFELPKKTKILYISSGAVYGECIDPRSEKDTPHPTTSYGKAKLSAEQNFASIYSNQAVSLRVGNVVDGDRPYGIFSLLENAVKNRGVELFGDPNDCRDYIGVTDFLKAIERLILLDRIPEILNIGSGFSVSLEQLSSLMESELGKNFTITWNNRRAGDLSASRLNTGEMKKLLNLDITHPLSLLLDFVRKLKN